MIPDGIFLNLMFMFPEQNVMQIWNLPYVMNDVMHREPLFAECCQYCWNKGILVFPPQDTKKQHH